jgi:hypothetical protein
MLVYRHAPSSSRAAVLGVRQPARPYAASPRANAARSGRRARRRSASGREESKRSGPEPAEAEPAVPKSREPSLREKRRLLAAASARIEGTREYQNSLKSLDRLVASFREGLNEAESARWLEVEEAFLEHASRVNEAYFWEGARARSAARARHERAAIAALADIIARLARC